MNTHRLNVPGIPAQAEFCVGRIWVHMWLILYIHIYIYMCVCVCVCVHARALKSKLQHTRTWTDTTWPPREFCYRPAVFFHHLRHVALPAPQGTFRRVFLKLIEVLFYLLKMPNLKLCKSGCVCIVWCPGTTENVRSCCIYTELF